MTMTTLEFPLVLVNLKTYREGTGERAVSLAEASETLSRRTGVCVAVAPQALDLRMIAERVDIPVFSQHIDPVGYGKYTGHITPEAVADSGCVGTLINHSERRLELDVIEATVSRARDVGLYSVVCVDTPEKGRDVVPFKPEAVAIEPPELIGTGTPVSRARPEVVSGAVEAVKGIDPGVKVLCGAGITSGRDVGAAALLGADGVLVASGVVKAENPFGALQDLVEALKA